MAFPFSVMFKIMERVPFAWDGLGVWETLEEYSKEVHT